uniref:Uncharacterized protein n=1 Tax=Methylophaga nitratireducenticrescens TaxID=754476 RepID=I1XN12_METNJ
MVTSFFDVKNSLNKMAVNHLVLPYPIEYLQPHQITGRII